MIDGKEMKNVPESGSEAWKRLYDACDRIRQTAPWDYFCEIDIMEIRTVNDEEKYYCVVGGMIDEQKSLSVYKGKDGLVSLSYYLSMKDAEVDEQIAGTRRNCLECKWCGRESLRSRDRKILKSTGHSYRGKDAWPLFRKLESGYEAWFMSEEEAEIMAFVMEQISDGMKDLLARHGIADIITGNRMVRKYNPIERTWRTCLEPPVTSVDMVTQGCMITDEVLLMRLKKKKMTSRIMEIDSTYVPLPLKGRDRLSRSFYPKVCVMCDSETMMVEQSGFIDRDEEVVDTVLTMVIGQIESDGRPGEIIVRDTNMYGILSHLCSSINVPLYISPALEAVDSYLKTLALSAGDRPAY